MARLLLDERVGFLWRQHCPEGRRLAKTTGGGKMTLDEWLKFQREVQSEHDDARSSALFEAVATDLSPPSTRLV